MEREYILMFDSGLGGLSVLKEAMLLLPREHFLYFGDSANAPYGVKSKEEITKRCFEICEMYQKQYAIKAIVIACNTATSACAEELREKYPDLLIIGMEPAIKPALINNKGKKILVLATPFTLQEKKYQMLVHQLDTENIVHEVYGNELVEIVEQEELEKKSRVSDVFDQLLSPYNMNEVESMVLGCTHFVFYRPYLSDRFPFIHLIDGNTGTIKNLKQQLTKNKKLILCGEGSQQIENSNIEMIEMSKRLLKKKI